MAIIFVSQDLIKSRMTALDEDNYKEAMEASFKVFASRGISKCPILKTFFS